MLRSFKIFTINSIHNVIVIYKLIVNIKGDALHPKSKVPVKGQSRPVQYLQHANIFYCFMVNRYWATGKLIMMKLVKWTKIVTR